MSHPFAKKVSRPLFLVVLALVLAWAGGSPAAAEEPMLSLTAPDFEAFLASGADCIVPPADSAELPELFPAPQPKTGSCSPYCGYTGCRGVLVGSICTKSTGGQGTCYGPPMGKQCADGLPMCLCV
jgi:hypothetical protein